MRRISIRLEKENIDEEDKIDEEDDADN